MTLNRIVFASGLALAVSACGGSPAPLATAGSNASVSSRDTVAAIEAALLRGDVKEARHLIKAAAKRGPLTPQVQLLRDSIEMKPVELLGPQSYGYTVRAGDTITGVADRLLGNRLKAYQLARYNDLHAPFALTPGGTLRIPGAPPRAEPVRRPDPQPVRAATAPSPAPSTRVPPRRAAPVANIQPAANPALARQLRTSGLAALNQGAVARAVGLLRRAAAADPGNPLVGRDLARAERIAATVRARR